MPQKTKVDLTGIFQSVTLALEENQQTLDQADAYNQNHGSNMVQTFQTITDALEKKKGSSSSTALAYAAKTLEKSANSGSSRLYAQNLNRAAAEFKGKKVDAQGAMQLLQTLIGGPSGQSSSGGDLLGSLLGGMTGEQPAAQSPSSSGDLLGSLLGGMTGEQPAAQSPSSSGDLLGSLLGGMTGGNNSNGLQDGLDMQDLLSAGMAFMQAKQSGGSTVQALVQAFMAGSGMGNTSHRQESTQVVIQSFLQALGSANTKR